MATLKELADRTGYSPATISRILTGDPALAVSAEARKRVLEEAGRLNYTATRSRRGRTPKGVLRVGLAEMLTPAQQLDDPFYLYLSGFVRQACLDRRFTCVPLEGRGDQFLPPDSGGMDAIVAIGLFTPGQVQCLGALSQNVVFVDSSPMESLHDSVVLNYPLGISLALDHLIGLGHRWICFAGPAFKLDDHRQTAPEVRRQLFVQLARARGLDRGATLLDCPMEVEGAARGVAALLARGGRLPTALLCANEEIAIGAVCALREGGVRVPQDVSVLSFNDTPRSALIDPPLTSVSTHVEEMARTALRLLAERCAAPGKESVRALPLKVVVPPALTLRDSTAAPRADHTENGGGNC